MIFDQFQRYKTAQIIANGIKEFYRIDNLNILEIGANEQENLSIMLPDDKITYSDIFYSQDKEKDEKYIIADATDLKNIADSEYDFVLALDVYEHIPVEKRNAFLKEVSRVSRYGTLICFPYDIEAIKSAEFEVNEYYKKLFDKDHIWLSEHAANGLPPLNEVYEVLHSLGYDYLAFDRGDLYLWQEMTKALFFTYYAPHLTPIYDKIDEYYQKSLFYSDRSDENYRKFITIAKDKDLKPFLLGYINNVFQGPMDKDLMEMFRNTLHTLSDAYKNLLLTSIGSSIQTIGKIYLDTGKGFSEQESIDLHGRIQNKFHYSVDLPLGVQKIRFDPVEGTACIIKDLVIDMDGSSLRYSGNGTLINNILFFTNTDPQCDIVLEGNTGSHLSIQGEISFINDSAIQAINKEAEELIITSEKLKDTSERLKRTTEKLITTTRRLQEKTTKLDFLENKLVTREQMLDDMTHRYNLVIHSHSWKLTRPLRFFTGSIRKFMRLSRKAVACWKYQGFKCMCSKVIKKIKSKLRLQSKKYTGNGCYISAYERKQQETHVFPRDIKISILVPVYNTPEQVLQEMIQSVRNQTYKNWELCLADGSEKQYTYIQKICNYAAKSDTRIIYKALENNLGISENTNRCIEISTGEYLGLLDHDDILHPSALYEVMKAICEENADFIYTDENTFSKTPDDAYNPHFKPDFSPDMLRSQNYICHFTAFSRKLLDKVGGYRSQFNGSQDYDMVLRLTEVAGQIVHIPKILYFWRASDKSVANDISAKPYAIESAKAAVAEQLERLGLEGNVEDSILATTYRIRYHIRDNPLVSIMIPNKDHVSDLSNCIESVIQLSTYKNYEIVIIENGSTDQETFTYYEQLRSANKNIKIVEWDGPFNYSAINNFGFKHTQGEHVILLNNDILVISPGWIQEMLMFSQRGDVGAVGAMLYYPDDTIQHAGVILGLGGVAGHSHKYFRRGDMGYMGRLTIAQNLSAVTAACMMVPRKVFEELHGLDEDYQIAFNDVDFCMRIRQAGYLIVFTPYAELYHCESKSRGYEDTPEKQHRFNREVCTFQNRWGDELEAGDPYYNPNLTMDVENFSFK